jgi:hypothetical protein
MKMSRMRDVGLWAGAGAALLACTACCIPLVAPLLAWLGVAALALTGPYGVLLASLCAGVIALVALRRRRQRLRCQSAASCACAESFDKDG